MPYPLPLKDTSPATICEYKKEIDNHNNCRYKPRHKSRSLFTGLNPKVLVVVQLLLQHKIFFLQSLILLHLLGIDNFIIHCLLIIIKERSYSFKTTVSFHFFQLFAYSLTFFAIMITVNQIIKHPDNPL